MGLEGQQFNLLDAFPQGNDPEKTERVKQSIEDIRRSKLRGAVLFFRDQGKSKEEAVRNAIFAKKMWAEGIADQDLGEYEEFICIYEGVDRFKVFPKK